METGAGFGSLLEMRILIALNEGDIAGEAEALAEIAAEHQLVVVHDSDGAGGEGLELALRNALPDRDVITVVPQVVVSVDDPAFVAPPGVPSPDPSAIAGLRSIRTLIDAGALVICGRGGRSAVVIDRDGTMRRIDAVVDGDLTAALLARRLDADLFLVLDGLETGATATQEEAARRFTEATGRRAAIGAVMDAAGIVRGEAGPRVAAHRA